jgi:hypothetical protein
MRMAHCFAQKKINPGQMTRVADFLCMCTYADADYARSTLPERMHLVQT